MKVAVIQMRSTDDVWWNLLSVQDFIKEAEAQKCEMICFPENVFYRGPSFEGLPEEEKPLLSLNSDGKLSVTNEFSKALGEVLNNTSLIVSFGSVRESRGGVKPTNSHWVISPNSQITSYSKIHLFHFGDAYQESLEFDRGRSPVAIGFNDFRFGLSVCYDLRFPELYRFLTLYLRVNVHLVPAAFTRETGRFHWFSLLRARAIENQSYVLASAQWGDHLGRSGKTLHCFGNSCIIDPWGNIVQQADELGEELLTVHLTLEEISRVREALPALNHSIFRLSYE